MKPGSATSLDFSPGFRFSTLDAAVLVVGAVAAIGMSLIDRNLTLAVAFVVAHFFLFCNVIRMSRPLELTWAIAFAALTMCCVMFELISWTMVFVLSSALTALLVFIEVRRPSYHGVGWRIVNPKLREWWLARTSLVDGCQSVEERHER